MLISPWRTLISWGISSILRTESLHRVQGRLSGRSLQLTQEAPYPGNARVILRGDAWSTAECIGDHSAELVEGEGLAVLADAYGTMEDGTGRVEFDEHRYQKGKR